MTKAANELLSAAMNLSESERAELAAQLLDTLDPAVDHGYIRAWESELINRMRELDDGTVRDVSWKEARRMIRQGGGNAEAR